MNARKVTIPLKANSVGEFMQTLEKDILPRLRNQKGFQDEITFLAPGTREVIAISFWDTQENEEVYARETYAEVLKALSKVLDGTPHVQSWQVLNSTSHKPAAAVAA
jgi:heme-degrading monooxygenase HmoA